MFLLSPGDFHSGVSNSAVIENYASSGQKTSKAGLNASTKQLTLPFRNAEENHEFVLNRTFKERKIFSCGQLFSRVLIWFDHLNDWKAVTAKALAFKGNGQRSLF